VSIIGCTAPLSLAKTALPLLKFAANASHSIARHANWGWPNIDQAGKSPRPTALALSREMTKHGVRVWRQG
jgi:hypothetical protein